VGPPVPAECNAVYIGWLYWPRFSFPFHLQARSTSDDARHLYQRKVEPWATNDQLV
jgi:hypothetical protein